MWPVTIMLLVEKFREYLGLFPLAKCTPRGNMLQVFVTRVCVMQYVSVFDDMYVCV